MEPWVDNIGSVSHTVEDETEWEQNHRVELVAGEDMVAPAGPQPAGHYPAVSLALDSVAEIPWLRWGCWQEHLL
jgi:hypothetical protein